jgi:glycosyltransferase involved in cell wall biosynthesis
MSVSKTKILYLASWYPSRNSPVEGIFVQKHAEAAAHFSDISVLYFTFYSGSKGKIIEIEPKFENEVFTVRVYLKKLKIRIPLFTFIFNIFRYVIGICLGLRIIFNERGTPALIQVNVASRIGIFALILKLLFRIPYIVLEHSTTYVMYKDKKEYQSNISFSERIITYINFRYSNGIIGVSDYLNECIKNLKGVRNKFYTVPNVITIPDKLDRHFANKDKIKVLTISLLNKKGKNIKELITGFNILIIGGRKDLFLYIIGEGPDRTELESYSNELGLLNLHIFFLGYVPNNELGIYFETVNFFILPSRYETFSVVTAEAIAHGVPVVATKCGGPEEFVTANQGLLVNNMDIKALISGIEFMSINWENYDPVKLRNYANSKFDSLVVGRQLVDIYYEILNINY